jgi:quercetin dioxygenase-like cupin family protein
MIVRNYASDDGQSVIEEMPLSFEPYEGDGRERTALQAATGIRFVRWPAGVYDWHNAPRRQYVITLSGQAELEVSGGRLVRLGAGDVALEEDLTGEGHRVRVLGNQPLVFVVVPLAVVHDGGQQPAGDR